MSDDPKQPAQPRELPARAKPAPALKAPETEKPEETFRFTDWAQI